MSISPPQWPLVSSSSNSLSAELYCDAKTTTIGPIDPASGSAPPSFDNRKTIASIEHTYSADPRDPASPTLQLGARDLVSEARSSGIGVDTISTTATSDIASASLVLTGNPLSALAVLGLSVAATFVHAGADASYVFGPDKGSLTGDASFHCLTISGALIGRTLTFSGNASANKVIFDSPTVTITLDKQVLSGFYPPVPTPSPITAPLIPARNQLTTDAIDIQLKNAHLFGCTVSGHFDLGQASATLWPSLPARANPGRHPARARATYHRPVPLFRANTPA